MRLKNGQTDHPTLITTTINELGQKYKIEDSTQHNHTERLRGFLNELKKRVVAIQYKTN